MMLSRKLMAASGSSGNILDFDYASSASIDRALSTSAFTFSAQNIGAASPNRILVIGVAGFAFGAGTISNPTVTVGGVSATRLVNLFPGVTTTASLTLFALQYPTGTSADVVVSHGHATTCAIGIYRMISVDGNITPYSTDNFGQSPTSSPVSRSLAINTLTSAVVGFSWSINGINPTWTGVSKDFGFDARSNEWFSGASLYPANVTGSLSVTRTETTTPSYQILASWD